MLGMQEQSLRRLVGTKDQLGLVADYIYFDELVQASFKDDVAGALESLRFRTFGSHSDFCRRLHNALKQEQGIDVDPLFCATSELLDEKPECAHYFDCLTLRPLSVRHSLWLDFRKPLVLPPDRCSRLLFAENQDELRPHVAGSAPPDVSAYIRRAG